MERLDYAGIIEEAYVDVARKFEEGFWDSRDFRSYEEARRFPNSNSLLEFSLCKIRKEMFGVLDMNL